MSDHPNVAIFWDYENCSPPSSPCGLGYDIVNNISRIARLFGSITTFRAYLDISAQSPKSVALRSELQSSGVSLIDCPHNGKKDVVDKMILVDMLAFAVDHSAPATFVLITGDRDYAYALSVLKLRKYQVILVVPSAPHTSPSLESQASLIIDWGAAALRTRTEAANSTQVVRQPYLDLDASLVTEILRELQELSLDDPDSTLLPNSTSSPSTSGLRRMSVRDLLEPSRHLKNAGSLDSTQEFTLNPASPRKSTSTASDSTHEGLPIPKSPSHSWRASVSTGPTRARSVTLAMQSSAVLEKDIPVKNPPPSVGRSSASDIADVAGPAKRCLSVLPSLDGLELPLHDSRPPSSIIAHLPPEPVRSTGDIPASGKPATRSSHKLNHLVPPFVATKVPTGSESIPNSCRQQSHTMVGPTSPIIAPMKPLTGTITTVGGTSQVRDTQVPEHVKHTTGLRIEDNDGNPEQSRSILHRVHPQEGARDGTNTSRSNYHSYAALHTIYSPPSRNAGLYLADTPSSRRVSPPTANFSGVSDDINSAQFATFPHESDTRGNPALASKPVLPSTTFPSVPFTTTDSHETDENERRQTWTKFKPLIHLLLAAHERGIARSSRSTIAVDLVQADSQVYKRAGALRFRDYTAMAEQAGLIELGGEMGDAWIALHPHWTARVDNIFTTHIPVNGTSSPMPDPPKVIQGSSLAGCNTPPIERAASFQTLTSTSSICGSLESSNTFIEVPTNRQGRASLNSIPARFQPLIDVLIQMRAEGSHQVLRSVVGQSLRQGVYAQAGVSGFKEYVCQASEAELIQFGGFEGYAWIRLHPELRV